VSRSIKRLLISFFSDRWRISFSIDLLFFSLVAHTFIFIGVGDTLNSPHLVRCRFDYSLLIAFFLSFSFAA